MVLTTLVLRAGNQVIFPSLTRNLEKFWVYVTISLPSIAWGKKWTYPVDVRDRGLGVLFEVFPDRLSVFAINVALSRRKINQHIFSVTSTTSVKFRDIYLLGNRKSHSIVELTELKNLIIGPRLLSLKLHRQTDQSSATSLLQTTRHAYLVARETNDCQSLITILLVQSLEILVLRSQTYGKIQFISRERQITSQERIKLTTLARNIDKQESLALQVTKGKSGLGKLNLFVSVNRVSRWRSTRKELGPLETHRVGVDIRHGYCMYCRKRLGWHYGMSNSKKIAGRIDRWTKKDDRQQPAGAVASAISEWWMMTQSLNDKHCGFDQYRLNEQTNSRCKPSIASV